MPLRQHHEQGYRVGVYNEFLDAVPCGYDKDSPDPKRPRWQRGGMQMIGWLVALVYNAVADLATELAGDWEGCHIRTLRRMFFNRPDYDLASAVSGTFAIAPTNGMIAVLARDYANTAAMIFGGAPKFPDILTSVREIDRIANTAI